MLIEIDLITAKTFFIAKFKKKGILKFTAKKLIKKCDIIMIQLSVFLEDKPGVLANFIKLLLDNKILLYCLTVAKTSEHGGLLLILVDKLEQCIALLDDNNYLLSTTDVIAIRLNGNPNALYQIPKILGDNKVNIDFCYTTLVKDDSLLILRVEDDIIEEVVKLLKKKGFTIIL